METQGGTEDDNNAHLPLGYCAIALNFCSLDRLRLMREQVSRPVVEKLHAYLLKIREQLLAKSEAGQAVPTAAVSRELYDHTGSFLSFC